ncbi:MAG: family peptidase [Paucimonas sp.]|nr:family peptidase [Paucimonas sp.]
MRHRINQLVCILLLALVAGCASTTRPGAVNITRQQFLLIPAETVERMALTSYAQQAKKADEAGKLIRSGPQYDRVIRVATKVRDQVSVFRDDAKAWKWQMVLIDAPILNATCAPGGKITIYTGIIDKLSLTDDELAMIMGHEIAHALREHGRERVSQAFAANTITQASLARTRDPQASAALVSQFTKYLFLMPNSRENESEADKIGLELAARAGFDPNASITFWRKMAAASAGTTPEFLSTHPANERRIADLRRMIPAVMPLFEAAKR